MLFYWPFFNTLIAYLFRGMLTMLFRLPAAQVTFLNLTIYVLFIVAIVKSGAPLVLFGWPVVIVFCHITKTPNPYPNPNEILMKLN